MNDRTYPTRHLTWVILLGVVATTEIRAADVTIGPYTFDDKAFASEAIQLDSGSISFGGGASTLDEALAGYTPATGLTNIGYLGGGNHFQLNFDVPIRNEAGNDLVFFDRSLRGNTRIRDDYEIALRPKDSDYTAYRFYDEEAFNDTDFPFGPLPLITLYSLAIDLSDYGLAEHAVVDSLRFRALPGKRRRFLFKWRPPR